MKGLKKLGGSARLGPSAWWDLHHARDADGNRKTKTPFPSLLA